MKIRTDFVSNSSSTSFMLVGEAYNHDDLVKIAECNKLTSKYHQEGESYKEWDSYDIISELEKKFPEIEFCRGIDNYYDEYCIGMGYGAMKSDETKQEFEERIAKLLSKMTGQEITKVSYMIDGGRDS